MSRSNVFPVGRVKKIVKADGEIRLIKKDALKVLDQATAEFVGVLVHEWVKESTGSKTLTYGNLAKRVNAIKAFEFLTDVIPSERKGGIAAMEELFLVSAGKSDNPDQTPDGEESRRENGEAEDARDEDALDEDDEVPDDGDGAQSGAEEVES